MLVVGWLGLNFTMSQVKIARNGKVIGEYAIEKITELKRRGSIRPTDHYWMDGMTEWATVESKNWPRPPAPVVVKKTLPERYRSSDSCLIAGVCGGMAHKWNYPVWAVRIGFMLFSGLGLIVYGITWATTAQIKTNSIPPGSRDRLGRSSSVTSPLAFVCTAFVLTVIILIIVGLTDTGNSGDGVGVAYKRAQVMVRSALNSPSTATFPSITSNGRAISYSSFASGKLGFEVVSAYVDAQNSFGARTRLYWTAAYIVSKESSRTHFIPSYLELDGAVIYGSRSEFNATLEAGNSGKFSQFLVKERPKK